MQASNQKAKENYGRVLGVLNPKIAHFSVKNAHTQKQKSEF
jgi:hypothetical protein